MPLLSRTLPATASSGRAEWAQDDVYAHFAPDHMWTCRGDCWLAYDLSTVPEPMRASLYVVLSFGGNAQYQLNVHALGGVDLRGVPTGGYTLQGAASSTGPWTTLVTVPSLAQAARVHRLDFTGYRWLRYTSSDATKLKMDVYSAASGVTEGLVIYGDSIANIEMVGLPQSWFSTGVGAQRPGSFPPIVGGGIAFTTAMDGRDMVVKGTGGFSKEMGGPLLGIYDPVPYVGLTFGTNDAAPGPDTNEVAFYQAYAEIIRASIPKGSTVAIATPVWAPDASRQIGLKKLIGRIGLHGAVVPDWAAGNYALLDHVWHQGKVYRCTTKGTSVSGPSGTGADIRDGGTARWQYVESLREKFGPEFTKGRLVAGPDLYSLFRDRPDWLVDGLHPNAAGTSQWRKAWVDWALAIRPR
jgi:lysophospholipase L1-like esterase